ncbi:helix-turn-helix domain-containing protein [uncultured Enterococcus sp.]|uniref:helix-turn-helix domain-containing protein n=1 Tax=uncultured Enterococcus sp. TaxID=167972 RepID=UPI002AA9493C|nr:helix-turn-helix domain-containing protein [uncultured Enterococcus sp.]
MERLLSNEMNRRVLLLNELYSTTEWLTSEQLTKSLKCSSKTLFFDCQYLEERWGAYLTIETSKKSGIKMITAPHQSIHDIYSEIIKESSAFILLESIFFHPNNESDFFEEKLFMSKSTLYRLTKKINVSLRDRELKLSQKPFYLFGKTERQIRYFFAAYFLEVYGIHDWPFLFDKEKILAFIQKIDENFQLQLTDIQIIHLAFSIAVTLIRQQQGYYVQIPEKEREELAREQEQLLIYQNEIYGFTGMQSKEIADCWYEDFIYTFFWWDFGWKSLQEKQEVESAGEDFVETIRNALTIPVTESSKERIIRLFQNTYTLHKMFPFKKYMIYDRFLFSSKAIQQNYVVFSAVVSKALKILEEETGFPWWQMYQNELLHEVMIYWEHLAIYMDQLRKTVSILVLSDLGQEHAQSMVDQLTSAFQYKISATYQKHVILDTDVTGYQAADLYVTNYFPEGVLNEQLIVVEDVLSSKDLNDLRDFIDKARLILPEDIPYLHS